jgi:hypothetical protein
MRGCSRRAKILACASEDVRRALPESNFGYHARLSVHFVMRGVIETVLLFKLSVGASKHFTNRESVGVLFVVSPEAFDQHRGSQRI